MYDSYSENNNYLIEDVTMKTKRKVSKTKQEPVIVLKFTEVFDPIQEHVRLLENTKEVRQLAEMIWKIKITGLNRQPKVEKKNWFSRQWTKLMNWIHD